MSRPINPRGPLLYLFRSFVPDTAGPGRARGGTTTGLALLPYDVEGLDAMVIGHGVEVPNSNGRASRRGIRE
jgi:N-methylhydantoinase B